jgi:hypothetical protein
MDLASPDRQHPRIDINAGRFCRGHVRQMVPSIDDRYLADALSQAL